MDIKQVVRKGKIKLNAGDIRPVASNPHMPDFKANHYRVTLRATIGGKQRRYTLFYSQGYGIKHQPRVADVLDCLASDAGSVEFSDFADFCANTGFSRHAESSKATYRACQQEVKRLKQLLGNELYAALLDADRL